MQQSLSFCILFHYFAGIHKKRVNQKFKRTFHKLTDELLVSNTGMDTEITRPTPCQSKTTNKRNAAIESLTEAQHKLTTNSMHLL